MIGTGRNTVGNLGVAVVAALVSGSAAYFLGGRMADDRNERVKEYSSPEKFQKPQYGSIEDMKKVSRFGIITINVCHMEDYHACK